MSFGNRASYVRSFATAAFAIFVSQIAPPSAATTATTVVNSVLSAYGIPMINDDGGFTSSYVKFDEGGQRTICAFAFPSSWVGSTRGSRLFAASNYQTGDDLILNVAQTEANTVQDLSALAIAAETMPSEGLAKVSQEKASIKGGVNYTYLTVRYNVTTRSGYDVERIAYVAATVRQGKLFTLATTISSERRNKMDVTMNAIRASFRVGDASLVEITASDRSHQVM
ncbi:unnamed protein product [Scytosiphon promiscuus]